MLDLRAWLPCGARLFFYSLPMKPIRIRTINGNCIDVLKKSPTERVDFVLTDPPYLVNYRSRDGHQIANDRQADWLSPAFQEIARVLKYGHYCVCFYGWKKAELFLNAWKLAGLYPVAHFVWHKGYASGRKFVRSTHECAYLLVKGSSKQPLRPNVLLNDVLPWSYSGNKLHPTQKPLTALEPLIEAFSAPGDVVLDPFMGSGSTGEAAVRHGRNFLGIEIDEEYHTIATRRLAQI